MNKKKSTKWSKKNNPWTNRKMMMYKRDTEKIADYLPSSESYSVAMELTRCIDKGHPGGYEAFFTIIMFMVEMKPNKFNFHRMYQESLRQAMNKQTAGKVYYGGGERSVLNEKDMEQLLLECLRASDIEKIMPEVFIRRSIGL